MITVEEARARRGLSRAALAALAGISEATVYRVERRRARPRPRVALRLAAALELPPDEVEELRAAVARSRMRQPVVRAQ